MNKEYASGAIVYRRENGTVLFLLVYSFRNSIWGFPKGHIEPGEDERTAAFREIKEETGLSGIALIEGFREEDVYTITSNQGAFKGQTVEKHSIYFLCEVKGKNITVDGDEITGYRWCRLEEALSLIEFEDMREILRKAAYVV